MKRLVGVADVAGALGLAGCAAQPGSADAPSRATLLGALAPFLTSGRPEAGSASLIAARSSDPHVASLSRSAI